MDLLHSDENARLFINNFIVRMANGIMAVAIRFYCSFLFSQFQTEIQLIIIIIIIIIFFFEILLLLEMV